MDAHIPAALSLSVLGGDFSQSAWGEVGNPPLQGGVGVGNKPKIGEMKKSDPTVYVTLGQQICSSSSSQALPEDPGEKLASCFPVDPAPWVLVPGEAASVCHGDRVT